MVKAVVRDIEHLLVEAATSPHGIEVAFADGHKGTLLFDHLRGLRPSDILALDLPTPHTMKITTSAGDREVPSDYIRYTTDPRYRAAEDAGAAQDAVTFGARLRDLRLKAALTSEALAARCAITPAALARIETGADYPALPTLQRLAAALGLSLGDLVVPPSV